VDLGTWPPTPPPPPPLTAASARLHYLVRLCFPPSLWSLSAPRSDLWVPCSHHAAIVIAFFLYAGCFKDPSLDVLCDLSLLGIGLAEWLLLTGGWWEAKNSRCGSCDIYPFRFLFVGMVGCWNLLLSRVLQHQRHTRFLLSAEVSVFWGFGM
jgi:hypothetical protein